MSNTLTLEMRGVDQTLKFNLRTLNYIGEITGADPMLLGTSGGKQWKDSIEQVSVIITAALLSNAYPGSQNFPGTPKEELEIVKEWVLDLLPADLYRVMEFFVKFMNPGVAVKGAEGAKDTRPEAPNVE